MNTNPPSNNQWLRFVIYAAAGIVIFVVALAALAGCSTSAGVQAPKPTEPATITASGVITLTSTSLTYAPGGGCAGRGGFSDIHAGAQVVVSDSTGKTVAIGELEQGTSTGAGKCAFAFEVDGVPGGEGFYQVEISHRGRVQFSEAQLGWLDLTLGN